MAAAKKCRSVTVRGPSSLVQLRRGAGLPPAMHCRTAVSPRVTVLSSRGLMKEGVSVAIEEGKKKVRYLYSASTPVSPHCIP